MICYSTIDAVKREYEKVQEKRRLSGQNGVSTNKKELFSI